MDKHLENIKNLLTEVKELIKLRDSIDIKYNDTKKKIENHINFLPELDKKEKKINDLEAIFLKVKTNTMAFFTWPIGMGAGIIYFFDLWNSGIANINLFFTILGFVLSAAVCAVGIAAPALILNLFLPDKTEKFLLKRFVKMRNYRNEIDNLQNEITFEEVKFAKLEKERDQLYNSYIKTNQLLSERTKELIDLEERYYSSFAGKTIFIEDSQDATINQPEHGKRKIRIPKENENLEN